jgi:chromate transporter
MKKNERRRSMYSKRFLTPRQLLEMGLVMAKISCFTFGGGWSILAQMQREFSEKRGWIGEEELMDFASVGRSLPGIMILNNTTMFGYRRGGVPGAIIADIGLVLPPLAVICIVTGFYDAIKDNVWVAKAMIGVRAAVVPVILEATVKLGKKGLVDKIAWGIMLAALAASLFTPIGNVAIVVLGAVAGLLIKGGKRDAVS